MKKPRQKLFSELEKLLTRARQVVNKTPNDVTFEDLDAVLFLVRRTVDGLKEYRLKRELLLEINAFLVDHRFDLRRLDRNWDGTGIFPTTEFEAGLVTICEAVADRVPADKSPIQNPFDGQRTTGCELRTQLSERCTELGLGIAAAVFVA